MDQTIRSPHLFDILSKGKMLRFSKGQTIDAAQSGASIHMVVRGYVKRYLISNSGSLGVQMIYGPEDVFSLTQVYKVLLGQSLYDGPETYYYTAMGDVRLMALDASRLIETARNDPLLYRELFSEAGQHLKRCVHTIENISMRSSYVRVAHQLLFLAQEYGEPTPEGVYIKPPLTQQDIADLLGMTRETVTMAITKLRSKDIVQGARQLMVTDMSKLAAEAYT